MEGIEIRKRGRKEREREKGGEIGEEFASNFETIEMEGIEIRNVWADNFGRVMNLIRTLKCEYPYVALATTVGSEKLPENLKELGSTHYENFCYDISDSEIIQVGLCMFNADGELPRFGIQRRHIAWEFNIGLRFNINSRRSPDDEALVQILIKEGVEFGRLWRYGIAWSDFCSAFQSENMWEFRSANTNEYMAVTWVGFGVYDFGMLLKLMHESDDEIFPATERIFIRRMQQFFKKVYDVQHIVAACHITACEDLEDVARGLNLEAVVNPHRSGPKCVLIARVFNEVKTRCSADLTTYEGVFHGLQNKYKDVSVSDISEDELYEDVDEEEEEEEEDRIDSDE